MCICMARLFPLKGINNEYVAENRDLFLIHACLFEIILAVGSPEWERVLCLRLKEQTDRYLPSAQAVGIRTPNEVVWTDASLNH
jgi:hypothetical protein